VLLECAGNGRKRMVPVPSGVAWDVGAVSCAHFTGIALADVLLACGASQDAVEVLFVGADRGEVSAGRTVAFERSVPIEKAHDRSVLLADEMNGQPLTREHGYPLRLLVPQWYAVSSVKWLTEIRVLTEPFSGHFQTERYVYVDDPIAAPNDPVRAMRVRALIASPLDATVLHGTQHSIKGIAWSGAAPVARVEVSTDGGVTWHDAACSQPLAATAPVAWEYEWHAAPGRFRILARASDAAGNTQPLEPLYNRLGYGNNVVHAVGVTVDAGTTP
jgi:DMSO/TMAO reductase YedYZ molybdopterin-dependent catalytic subunit